MRCTCLLKLVNHILAPWRYGRLSPRAKVGLVVLAVTYVIVFCCIFAYVLSSASHSGRRTYNDAELSLASQRDMLGGSVMGNRVRMVQSPVVKDAEPRRRPGLKADDSLFGALKQRLAGWWSWLFSHGHFLCGAFACGRFQFPEELPSRLERVCSGDTDSGSVVPLVIVISSPVDEFQSRQAVRDTWLKHTAPKSAQSESRWPKLVPHIFVVGGTDNATVNNRLKEEIDRHGDVLQGEFQDSSDRAAIFRTLLGLYWVAQQCGHAQNVMKVKDDSWVNLPLLMERLALYAPRQSVGVSGYCTGGTPLEALKDDNSLRFANSPFLKNMNPMLKKNLSPSLPVTSRARPLNEAPPWCHEAGYVINPAVVSDLRRIVSEVPIHTIVESVYISWLLQRLHLTVVDVPGFNFSPQASRWVLELCELHGQYVVLRPNFTPPEMRFIWQEGKCKPKPRKLFTNF